MRLIGILMILALAMLAAAYLASPAHAEYVPLYSPEKIAIDASGNVYATMFGECIAGDGIHVYAPDGREIRTIREPKNLHYADMAIDRDGNVYAINTGYKRVERIEKNGAPAVIWTEDNRYNWLEWIVSDSNGNLYVSDINLSHVPVYVSDVDSTHGNNVTCSRRVLKIRPDSNVTTIYEEGRHTQLVNPYSISVSSNGTIFLVNGSRCIHVIYPDGSSELVIHTRPDNGTFHPVIDVVAGGDGYIYVSESASGRIQKLTADYALVAMWEGCGPDRFVQSGSIAVDDNGRVYVSDLYNQRIVWFDSSRYQYTVNDSGNTAGKGALWDVVIAGDNHTMAQRFMMLETESVPEAPGFTAVVAGIGIGLASLIMCLRTAGRD